jgi:cell division protein FtsB
MGRLGRTFFVGLLALAGYYTLFGGEYSMFELSAAKTALAAESTRLGCLDQVTDSLNARVEALKMDDATLEEIARRDWGMIRDGEILYRFPVSGVEESDDLDASVLAERCGASGSVAPAPEGRARSDAAATELAPD